MILLKVTDLKQYAYCPRIVFYQYVMPVEKKTTFKMEYGKQAEAELDELEKRRTLRRYGLDGGKRIFHKWVRSDRLGLSGILDLIIQTDNALYPVDFKYSLGRPQKNHLYQMTGYALILEDIYNTKVTNGFIYLIPQKSIVQIRITEGLKAEVIAMLDQIRRMIAQEAMPNSTAYRNRCAECEYRNYCGDVF
jgi:CRISPR-associated exonuclease Cas4